MSRWDTLKPTKTQTRGPPKVSSNRNAGPHHGHKQQDERRSLSSRQGRNVSQGNWRRGSNHTKTPGHEEESFANSLKQQLEFYRTGNKSYQPERVRMALDQITTSHGTETSGDTIILLVEILEIQDTSIQQAAAGSLEHRLKAKSVTMSKHQASQCIALLSDMCLSSIEKTSASSAKLLMKILGMTLISQLIHLPAEETAQRVVGGIFVPYLNSTKEIESSVLKTIFYTLERLFDNAQYSAALLAPLIQDVTSEGKEEKVENPLRKQIFSALERFVYLAEDGTEIQCIASDVFAKAINALCKIDVDAQSQANSVDFDMISMDQHIRQVFETSNHSLFAASLSILRALIKRYPAAMTRLGSRLILEPPRRLGAGNGPFLELAHPSAVEVANVDPSTTDLARFCLADFLAIMPWKVWLKPTTDKTKTVSGFRRKVIDSLDIVIQIATSSFVECDDCSLEALVQLAIKIFSKIPFNTDKLIHSAMNLWSSLATALLDSSSSSKKQEAITTVLIDSTGGKITPQGQLLPMCVPAHLWLGKEAASAFLNSMFEAVGAEFSLSKLSPKVLSAVLRTRPETAFTLWTTFESVLRECVARDKSETKLICIGILESFMLGRKDFGDTAEETKSTARIVGLTCNILENTRDDKLVQCRCSSFNTYGALLGRDWIMIDSEHNSLLHHFQTIQLHCEDANAKVRSAACKSMGDFCTQYMSSKTLSKGIDTTEMESRFKFISREICKTMSKALEDKNASVRSMALYCLGNLAVALRDIKIGTLLDGKNMLNICSKIYKTLGDVNDKVSGNAIRSVGHWGYMLSDSKTNPEDKYPLLRLIIDALSTKLRATLSLASPETKGNLSWKQRSIAKKHGWGACHSLAHILKKGAALGNEILQVALSEAVKQLLSCVEHISLLNEKVTVSAMAALRELQPLSLSELGGKTGLIGEALATCALQLQEAQYQAQNTNQKVVAESQLLLRHLLSSASILDANVVLKRDDFSRSTLDFLYGWMVENEVEGRAFEIFAFALQRPGLLSDVSLEQNFASRALQQYKKYQPSATQDAAELDDDADEL